MAELKTKPTDADVDAFIASIDDDQKRVDTQKLCELFAEVTGEPATMWGASIIGFDTYHYKYKSGREGDWMVAGFSPRKAQITIYIMDGFEKYQDDLARIGKHTTAKSCLYVKRLSDIDQKVLKDIVAKSVSFVRSGALTL